MEIRTRGQIIDFFNKNNLLPHNLYYRRNQYVVLGDGFKFEPEKYNIYSYYDENFYVWPNESNGSGVTECEVRFPDYNLRVSEYFHGNIDYIESINGKHIYIVDGLPVIINEIHDNILQADIVNNDFIFTPCYIIHENGIFAHGKTLHNAINALHDKLLLYQPVEKKLLIFIKNFLILMFQSMLKYYLTGIIY
jgi:hypothetical protein